MNIRIRSCLTLALAVAVHSGGRSQEGDNRPRPVTPLTWVFLDSSENTVPRPREDMARLQVAHLDNLTRLAEEGKSLAAGPLDGNSKKTRGIVVLTVPMGEKVDREFAEDPFLKEGYLKVRAYAARVLHGKISPPVEPFEMADYVIAMVRRDPELDSETGAELFQELAAGLADNEQVPLALAVSFPRAKDVWCGVLLFTSPHAVKMQKLLKQQATLASGELQADAFVQYLGRGIIDGGKTDKAER